MKINMNSSMILNLDVWTGSKVGSWHATLMREILLIQGEILYAVDTLHLSALFRKLFTFATSRLSPKHIGVKYSL